MRPFQKPLLLPINGDGAKDVARKQAENRWTKEVQQDANLSDAWMQIGNSSLYHDQATVHEMRRHGRGIEYIRRMVSDEIKRDNFTPPEAVADIGSSWRTKLDQHIRDRADVAPQRAAAELAQIERTAAGGGSCR